MNSLKKKLRNNSIYNYIKIHRHKINQGDESYTLKTIKQWWKKLTKIKTNGDISCVYGLEELTLLSVHIAPNDLQLNAISVKIQMIFFTKKKTQFLNSWNHRWPKLTRAGSIRLFDFRMYYKTTVIEQYSFGIKNRHIKQHSEIREPRNKSPHLFNWSLIDVPSSYNGGRSVSPINGVGKIGYLQWKRMILGPDLTSCKNQFKID
jgi:hypothetical protein